MNAFAQFPTRLHWTAQQLADAVPLQLHELFAFDARRNDARPAANRVRAGARRDAGYLQSAASFQRFRIR